MRVLIDTDVVLDLMLKRAAFYADAFALWQAGDQGRYERSIAAMTPINAYYYGSAIVVVPDPDQLYQSFAAGLRRAFGKLPVTGIPRILRPRKTFGTVRGFSVVDPGGNWLRVYTLAAW